jgi:hypothetical protein
MIGRIRNEMQFAQSTDFIPSGALYIESSDGLHGSPDGPRASLRLISTNHFASRLRSFKTNAKRRLAEKEEECMDVLWTLAVILLILWLLGLVTSFTLGGFIHILLVVAIIVVLIRVIQGRRPVL